MLPLHLKKEWNCTHQNHVFVDKIHTYNQTLFCSFFFERSDQERQVNRAL